MSRLLHWIAHWLGWNHGTIDSWWEGGKLVVGFRCSCGKTSKVTVIRGW